MYFLKDLCCKTGLFNLSSHKNYKKTKSWNIGSWKYSSIIFHYVNNFYTSSSLWSRYWDLLDDLKRLLRNKILLLWQLWLNYSSLSLELLKYTHFTKNARQRPYTINDIFGNDRISKVIIKRLGLYSWY